MDFNNGDSLNKALELNGSELNNYTLIVEEAKPRDGPGSGRGGGRSGGRRGGGRGGRRGGGRFGGAGRGLGNKPNLAAAGKGVYHHYFCLLSADYG